VPAVVAPAARSPPPHSSATSYAEFLQLKNEVAALAGQVKELTAAFAATAACRCEVKN
jgi:hypothetical protein